MEEARSIAHDALVGDCMGVAGNALLSVVENLGFPATFAPLATLPIIGIISCGMLAGEARFRIERKRTSGIEGASTESDTKVAAASADL